jgi:lipopolysaccharide transport system ATP-binding protein
MRDVSSSSGRTVLFVSHNMATIQQLCKRAILLREGSIVAEGDPKTIISSYMTSANNTGKVSLRDWKERITDKSGMIVSFEVCNERGAHVTSIFMGDKLRFLLTIEFYRPVVQMQFGIFVHSVAGDGILELRSSHDGLYFDSSGTCVTVEAVVNKVDLYPGEYMLSPWVWDKSSPIDIDWVQYCCKLSVLPAPGVHGELTLKPEYGRYFVPSSWAIRDSS